MAETTIYLARKLRLPSGNVLERYVVTVSSGHVLGWCPFDGETHSMLLVEELTLCSAADGTLYVADVCF
jgi:hypothetical protein